ncbi:hypothetical protein Q3G72_027070 [Acer saccharum]|nr:hypothetical protein Q3G72_027070 [Acer saccharum]
MPKRKIKSSLAAFSHQPGSQVDLINSLTIFAIPTPTASTLSPSSSATFPTGYPPKLAIFLTSDSLLPATGDCSDDGDEAWRWSDDGVQRRHEGGATRPGGGVIGVSCLQRWVSTTENR